MAIVISAAITVFLGLVWWFGHLLDQQSARHFISYDASRTELMSVIAAKDARIEVLDVDYKALAESYIRDTGKVFIRPVPPTPGILPPPQPNPYRMKPPPWANPAADPKKATTR